MLFWIVTGAVTVLAGGLFMRALLGGAPVESPADYDVRMYRDQLAGIDRDLERGVIGQDEADRLNVEISRRILAADGVERTTAHPSPKSNAIWAGAAVAAVFVGAFWLYHGLGAPGYPDLPMSARLERAEEFHQSRPAQADAAADITRPEVTADPDYVALVDRLRTAVADNPDDIQGLTLLARNEAALGNLTASADVLRHIIEVKGPDASAADFAALADTYVIAAGGYVSPEAEQALAEVLRRDADNGTARYYMGLMWAQTGRPDLAFQLWAGLLNDGPENAPWIAPIRDQIGMLAAAAGVDYTPPAALRGPDADAVAAAQDMSDEDRNAMIQGMVDRLADRLATEGGTPEEWARLITALGVLGQTDRAKAIWTEAKAVFADQPAALDVLTAAALQAGLSE